MLCCVIDCCNKSAKAKEMKRLAKDIERETLTEFFEYFETNWLENSVWSINKWCVYKLSVRTNNGEGWHNRLGMKADGKK